MTSLVSTPFDLRLRRRSPAEVALDLFADHLVGRSEVVLDLGDLASDARHEVGSAAYVEESATGTKWKTWGSSVWPYRSMRPMRCSRRDGLNGMSKFTRRWQ